MNVIDSSAWLEYFANGPNSSFFAPAIENVEQLIIPAIVIFEVFKNVLHQRGENDALQVIATMQQGQTVDLTPALALNAAKISVEMKLPMADSIILATTQAFNATLWTQDSDFENIDGVQYAKKIQR